MTTENLNNSLIELHKLWSDSGDYFQTKWDNLLDITGDDPFNLWIFGTTIYTMAVYWAYGAFFTFMDITNKPKFLRKFKVQPGTNEPVDIKKLISAIGVVLFNQIAVGILLSYLVFYVLGINGGMEEIRKLPNLQHAITQILCCILLTEIGFYYSHRLLHNKYIYKHIHKKHHEWISPISVTSIYCHPIEHIFSNLLPIFGGVVILKCHIVTAWIWFTMAIISTMSHHSGYRLPLFLNSEFHDFHHLKFNYCYGVTGLLDYLHGTDSLFRKTKAAAAKISKKSL